MIKWEYKIIDFDMSTKWGGTVDKEEVIDVLNQLGSEGWEVASTTTTAVGTGKSRKIIYTMKREV